MMKLAIADWTTHARAVARTVKHLPSRLLHPWRRSARIKRLCRGALPRSVLFVCHGNICRSPYAAYAFRRMLPSVLREYIAVRSAGFVGADRPTPANGVIAAGARGIDLQEHRSRPLTRELVLSSDLIVVMEARQRRDLCLWFGAKAEQVVVLGDLDPEPIETRTVRDPIFQGCDVFEATYSRIDRCVTELARAITGGHMHETVLPAEPFAPPTSVHLAPSFD